MPPRQIYLLSARQLPPETIAVAFAKTSRSPQSFRQIAAELTESQSAQFHEKWVVGYGHASVAEHAVLHLALENVSRVAIEAIESNRLASYTEKSTRYQKWNADDFALPPELEASPLREAFSQTVRSLFDAYLQALEPTRCRVASRNPRRPEESEEAYDRRIRSQYVDSCRFFLPAASLANVGLTANARVIENMLRKLLSHPLAEIRAIGAEIKQAALSEIPTLVKYAEPNAYLQQSAAALTEIAASAPPDESAQTACRLVDFDPQGEERVLAAALYRFGGLSYSQALETVQMAPEMLKRQWAAALLGQMTRYDTPLRELEYADFTFDLLMDQGAYAEFKRHRMMTQSPQNLTCSLGYAVPRLLTEAGLEGPYRAAMNQAQETWQRLAAENPLVAQYVVPNGFNRRVLARFNLREAYIFCQLRTAPNAHFSIRRVAQAMAQEIRRVSPLLAAFMRLPDEPDVEEKFFTQTA